MLQRFTYTEYCGYLEFVPGLSNLQGKYVVWWTNEVKPTFGASATNKKLTAPLVSVVFREIDANSELGATFTVDIKLHYLTLLRVGTVVENSRCIGFSNSLQPLSTVLDQHPSRFQIIKSIVNTKYNFGAYQIMRFDQNSFLEFNIGNQKTLLVPCLTYFIYCYGTSAELKRILTTYSWDEVKTRICGPINNMSKHNYLPVNLPRKLRDDDAVFVAHVMHDPYAEYAAKRIGSQLQVAHNSKLIKKVSLEVTPWFVEPMPVELLGVWLNSEVFLALTFTGISEPQGNAILLGRENSSSVETPYLGEGAGTAWKGALKPISSIPLIVIYSNPAVSE